MRAPGSRGATEDFALERVPMEYRRPMREVLWIQLGVVAASSEFVLAATLGYSMSVGRALIAMIIGTIVLILISSLIGIAGTREGLPSGLLARWCGFGRIGSAAISVVIVVGALAWFGIQNSICANAIQQATHGRLSFTLTAVLTGSLSVVITALGFKSLARTASLAVPLFVLAAGYGTYHVLVASPFVALLHRAPPGPPMSISTGVELVIGSFIVGAVLTPDLTRYCRRSKDAFRVMAIALVAGQIGLGLAGVLLSNAARTQDVVALVFQAAGWMGVTVVFLATIKVNDVTLYSTGLHMINVIQIVSGKETNRVLLIFLAGALGTLSSVLGILNHVTQFLMLLGIMMAPVGGIMIADYFLLRRHRVPLSSLHAARSLQAMSPAWNLWAFMAWGLGIFVGLIAPVGVTTVNAVVVSAAAYCLMTKAAGWIGGRREAFEVAPPAIQAESGNERSGASVTDLSEAN